MKIKRIVNGEEMEFELTIQEMRAAHFERQRQIDTDDIKLVLDENPEEYADLEVTEEFLDKAAWLYREYCDDNDWYYKVQEAIADARLV